MGKLLLLGGSQSQLRAAKKAKLLGHTVVLADYLQHPPAAAICDAHERVSTFDVQGCIDIARRYKVAGVFTVGSDQPVYTAAKVAQALGLPSPIDVDTAFKATNKRAMKFAFRQYGIPNAPHALVKPGDTEAVLSGLWPPLVLKPLDSQGQRGIFKVQTASQAFARLAETLSFSREEAALVESFYPSDEVTLSAFAVDGRLFTLTLTDRQLLNNPPHIGVCTAHRYPSIHAERTEEIEAMATLVAQALGITQGPVYIQFLIGDRGVIVNEAAARIGGAFEDVFIPLLTGFDILEAVIRLAAGETLSPKPMQTIKRPDLNAWVSAQLLFCRPGTIASITPVETLEELPCVFAAGYNYREGDRIPTAENATARFGHCVLATRDGDMDTALKRLYQTLRVLDTEGNNLVIPRNFDGKDSNE
ncbi:MAG TPA: ATP-grasp domain-containing protein [Candidatus Limiplasma sp.]|nr:ATP-grasp domain-containing protein [Candidatus Limiplasma sp.]HRX09949.1 ATP-grasp domain-containing protein [Candidatus Limiplasma sp.]